MTSKQTATSSPLLLPAFAPSSAALTLDLSSYTEGVICTLTDECGYGLLRNLLISQINNAIARISFKPHS